MISFLTSSTPFHTPHHPSSHHNTVNSMHWIIYWSNILYILHDRLLFQTTPHYPSYSWYEIVRNCKTMDVLHQKKNNKKMWNIYIFSAKHIFMRDIAKTKSSCNHALKSHSIVCWKKRLNACIDDWGFEKQNVWCELNRRNFYLSNDRHGKAGIKE